jgi:putative transposase
MLRAYKTELDPNDHQRTAFVRHAGACRFVYNWALVDRKRRYEEDHLSTNLYEQKRRFNALKHEQFPWLAEVASRPIEQTFMNVDRAFQNFFRRVKAGQTPGYPRFKSRKRGLGAFTMRDVRIEPRRIKLPRIGWVRLKEDGYLPVVGVKVLSANVSERAHRWYVSLQVEQEVTEPTTATGKPIGVDLGIKTLATCSSGKVFENPRVLVGRERQLKRLQRQLSRRVKGSNRRKESAARIATLHAKIARTRSHAMHQVTHYLTAIAKPSVVVIEDLNVAGMLRNHSLAKAISDASFAEFRRQLTYKAAWHGVGVLVADRWYPSSKTCSECGAVKASLSLSERTFVCEFCGAMIDRDLNAAVNLSRLAGKPSASARGEGKSLDPQGSGVPLGEAGTEQRVAAQVSEVAGEPGDGLQTCGMVGQSRGVG